MHFYDIIVSSHLDLHRGDRFAGMAITQLPEGKSCLAGEVVDQAALYGILNKVRDMGIDLLSVKCRMGELESK